MGRCTISRKCDAGCTSSELPQQPSRTEHFQLLTQRPNKRKCSICKLPFSQLKKTLQAYLVGPLLCVLLSCVERATQTRCGCALKAHSLISRLLQAHFSATKRRLMLYERLSFVVTRSIHINSIDQIIINCKYFLPNKLPALVYNQSYQLI